MQNHFIGHQVNDGSSDYSESIFAITALAQVPLGWHLCNLLVCALCFVVSFLSRHWCIMMAHCL